MKKKITFVLSFILILALSVFVLTACDLFGGNNENNSQNGGSEDKTLSEQECKNELSSAVTATLAKKSYRVNVVANSNMIASKQSTTEIEVDRDTYHVTTTALMGIPAESYYYASEGKYYSLIKVGDNYVKNEIETADLFNAAIAAYKLSARFGDNLTLDVDSSSGATVTVSGRKTGNKVHIEFVSEAARGENTVKLEKYIDITNGLLTNLVIRETEFENGVSVDEGNETTVTVSYDVSITVPNA